MKVKESMTPSPATCGPSTTLRLIARLMAALDCAAIPIAVDGKLLGIITDRDIACRAVASAKDAPQRTAREFMTLPVIAVGADDDLQMAAALMADNHLHHLPVLSDDGQILGIIAQSDLGLRMTNREFGDLARKVSTRPRAVYSRVDSLVKA